MSINRAILLFIVIFSSQLLSQAIAQNNVIYYTTNNDAITLPYNLDAFGSAIISNNYTKGLGCITFENDVTSIGEGAFKNNRRLTSITLPKSVSSIGDRAFLNCIKLSKIEVSDSLRYIGNNSFLNCKKLELNIDSLHLLDEIGDYAFANCDLVCGNVSSLPDSIKLGHYSFVDCPNISQTYDSTSQQTEATTFRFLTWNIEGWAWKKNYQIAEVDSVINSKGIKQMIAKHQPWIYTLNEVPYYLSKDISPKSSGINIICGADEEKVHTSYCITGIANAIVTNEALFDCKDLNHSANYQREHRHFGIATQYIEGKKVAIVSVHLVAPFKPKELTDSIRVSQVKDVVEAISGYDYVIIAGDFNCNLPNNGEDLNGSATLLRNAGLVEVVVKPWYVDHIYVKGFVAHDRGADNLDYKLSDHVLLWADLSIIQ